MSTVIREEGRQGFVLLTVLWSLGLLALVVAGLVAAARSGLGLAENIRGSAIAEAAADGSVTPQLKHRLLALRNGRLGGP